MSTRAGTAGGRRQTPADLRLLLQLRSYQHHLMREKKLKVTKAPLSFMSPPGCRGGGSWHTVREEQPADLCRDAEVPVSEPGHCLPQLLRQLSVILHQPAEHSPRQVEGGVELHLRNQSEKAVRSADPVGSRQREALIRTCLRGTLAVGDGHSADFSWHRSVSTASRPVDL